MSVGHLRDLAFLKYRERIVRDAMVVFTFLMSVLIAIIKPYQNRPAAKAAWQFLKALTAKADTHRVGLLSFQVRWREDGQRRIAARPGQRPCRSRDADSTALPSSTLLRPFRCISIRSAPVLSLRDGPRVAQVLKTEKREMSRKAEADRPDIYARITDRIVKDLEHGVRPWLKPWSAASTSGRITRPLRHNGLPYSGMNVLLLWSEQMSRGFASPTWMTFRQSLELGAAVRKGETGSTVVFASRFTRSEVDGNGGEIDREIPFLKAYSVFNVEQIDGLPESYYAPVAEVIDPVERIENADRFFRNTGATIRHSGNQAYYSPVTDHIQMPPFKAFRDAAGYAAVLAHETTHWTAREDRVGRDLSRYAKDRTDRAREELIALS
jgi:antirestriction protein ArdC